MNRRRARPQHLSPVELWLLRYQDALADEALIAQRIDSLDAYAKSTTRRITGLPHADHDGSLIPRLCDERQALLDDAARLQSIKAEIVDCLNRLPDDERRLLTAYYVEGVSLEKAAQFVPCSTRLAVDMKKRALRLVENMVHLG